MKEKESAFHEEWPVGYQVKVFRSGDKVFYHGREARVISALLEAVPQGEVPIVFNEDVDKDGVTPITVPPDDLERIKEGWES